MVCRDNLQLLRQRYYYATWKADGTRYMMLITMDGCYLIDRGFKFRRVQMRFPYRNANDVRQPDPSLEVSLSLFCLIVSAFNLIYSTHFGFKGQVEKIHHYTLLDGEMIIDTMPDSQKQERRYLIYDMMATNYVSVIEV